MLLLDKANNVRNRVYGGKTRQPQKYEAAIFQAKKTCNKAWLKITAVACCKYYFVFLVIKSSLVIVTFPLVAGALNTWTTTYYSLNNSEEAIPSTATGWNAGITGGKISFHLSITESCYVSALPAINVWIPSLENIFIKFINHFLKISVNNIINFLLYGKYFTLL